MMCIVCVPGESGKWVRDEHVAVGVAFTRVPAAGDFLLQSSTGRHYQVKLVTHVTAPGEASAILHVVPVVWQELLDKAHPDVQSASLSGPGPLSP